MVFPHMWQFSRNTVYQPGRALSFYWGSSISWVRQIILDYEFYNRLYGS